MSSADQSVRISLDFEVTKGNADGVVKKLRTKQNIEQLMNFVQNVLMDDDDTNELARLAGQVHKCFSPDEPCEECKGASRDWVHGLVVAQ